MKKNSGESRIVSRRSDGSDSSDWETPPDFQPTPRRKALRVFDESDEWNRSYRDESKKSPKSVKSESSDSDATPKKKGLRISDDSDETNKSDERLSFRSADGSDSSDSDVVQPTSRRKPRRVLDDSADVTKRFSKINMSDDISDTEKKPSSTFSNKKTSIIELSDDSTSSFEDGSKSKGKMKTKILSSKNTIERLPGTPQMSFLSSLSDETYGLPLHPKGKEFVDNYSKKKNHLALFLFQYYNFHIFDKKLPDIPLKWSSRLTSTAGRARMSRNKAVSLQWNYMIELSNVLLSSPANLRDTLVHEMCHVATCEIDNLPNEHHGPAWKAWARRCTLIFPELPDVNVCHQYERNWKYVYVCKCPTTKGVMTKIPAKNLLCKFCGVKMTLKQ